MVGVVRDEYGSVVNWRYERVNAAWERLTERGRGLFLARLVTDVDLRSDSRLLGVFEELGVLAESPTLHVRTWSAEVFGCLFEIHANALGANLFAVSLVGERPMGASSSVSELAEASEAAQQSSVEALTEKVDELSRVDKHRCAFLATLAHELRNPLAPLTFGLQLIGNPSCDAEATEKLRAMMGRQVSNLVHLVDDLLDVTRISEGKVHLRLQRIAMQVVLDNALDMARPAIEHRKLELVSHIPTEAVYLEADPQRMAQVFSNLLINAAKYTPAKGRITLSLRVDPGWCVVSVADTGIGIPPDSLSRIFEPFEQLSEDMELKDGGLGIGLALVSGLVALHGGSVQALSEGREKGSEFIVKLPLQ